MSPEIEILIYFLDSKKEKTKKIIFATNLAPISFCKVKINIFEFSWNQAQTKLVAVCQSLVYEKLFIPTFLSLDQISDWTLKRKCNNSVKYIYWQKSCLNPSF